MVDRLGTLEDPVQGVVTENSTFLNDYANTDPLALPTDDPDDPESFLPLPKKAVPEAKDTSQSVGDRLKEKAAAKKAVPAPAELPTDDPDDPDSFLPLPKEPVEEREAKKQRPYAKKKDEKNSYIGNLARSVGESAANIVGGSLRSAYIKGEALQDAIETAASKTGVGMLHWDEDGLKWRTSTQEEIDAPSLIGGMVKGAADYVAGTDFGYQPEQATTFDQVLEAPLSNVLPFVVEQGIASIPDMIMVSSLVGIPLYIDSRTGTLSVDRAKNEGREDPTLGDWIKSMPGAAVSAGLERLGLTKMIPGVGKLFGGATEAGVKTGKEALKSTLKAGGVEAVTEAGEEVAEALTTSLGTKKGVDWMDVIKRGAAGALAGGPLGAGVRAVTSTVEALGSQQAAPVQPAVQPPATGTTTPINPQPGTGTGTPPAQPTSPVTSPTQPTATGASPTPTPPVGGKAPPQDAGKKPAPGVATTQVVVNTTGVDPLNAAALGANDQFEEEVATDPSVAAAPAAAAPAAPAAAPAAAAGPAPISSQVLQAGLDANPGMDPEQKRHLMQMLGEAQAREATVTPPTSVAQPAPAATSGTGVTGPAPAPVVQPTAPAPVTQTPA